MKGRILIGVDFGTSGVKALAYDTESRSIRMSAYKSYPVVTPKPNYAEHIPGEWWNGLKWCVGKLLREGEFTGEDVEALCISSHTPTLTAVDKNGEPLTNGFIWADGRAVEESRELIQDYGERISRVNPATIRPYHILSKLRWLKQHEPAVYERTEKFLDCNNYLVYRLTGRYVLDISMASNYHFFNIYKKEWDEELAAELGVDLQKFPAVCDCDEIVGCVSESAADELGLSVHTKVLAGGSDTAMATLSMGIFTEDRIAYSCGTGSSVVMLSRCSEEDGFRTDSRLITIGYTDKDYMMNIGVMSNTGGAFKWMKEAVCHMETMCALTLKKDVFTVMSDYVTEAPIGANGIVFLPYLAGELSPLYNPNARGVFFGLSNESNKKEMLRAVMEGTCYAVKQNVEIVLGTSGMEAGTVKEIVATGGPCKSGAWMQMLSDILGIPVVIQEQAEGAPMGDIILAGCAVGLFSDQKTATEKMSASGRTYLPIKDNQKKYQVNYRTFCELQKCLLPCFDSHMRRQQFPGGRI